MISSSGHQVAAAGAAIKAYLMAESGFRYGASQYLHAGALDQEKNDALENLDGNNTLTGGNHSFELKVFSYFYEILEVNTTGPSQITVKAHSPGTFPSDDITSIDAGLKINIADQIYQLESGSDAIVDEDDNVTLVFNSAVSSFPLRTPSIL